jgi:hypothetical protein
MAIRNLQNLSPFMKQVLPLVEQLPPLYADLANGKDSFIPQPDETRQLVSPLDLIVHSLFIFSFSANYVIKSLGMLAISNPHYLLG